MNIFEPRYLKMIDDAISEKRVIAVVQPATSASEKEDLDTGQSPQNNEAELRQVGCTGRVTAFQETDDGRMLITLTGISRFRLLQEEATSTPYRIVNVDYKPFSEDLVQGSGEEDVDREHLLRVLKVYLETNELQADWHNILSSSSEFLVNTLSMISPYGPEEKQALLESKDLKERAEVLVALAEMELASRDDDSGSTIQ